MINPNAQINDTNLLLEQTFNGKQAAIWTALPGIIKSFDPQAMTCEVQPAVTGRIRDADGTIKQVNLPLLLDCPVVFPHAGACSLTFPIKEGDECLVVFSSRGIDFWWQNGGIQPPPEPRMHDLSDGFVIPGPYSQPKKIANVSTESVQLRSNDHEAFLEINPTTHNIKVQTTANLNATVGGDSTVQVTGNVTIKAASVTIDSPNTHITGTLQVDKLITAQQGVTSTGGSGVQVTGPITSTGDIKAGSISLQQHTHSGVQPGGGDTGQPK
ncbi:MAG TPA: hypothetical protein IAC66_07580 [Candidatus Aphodousia gallistercoris]|nr:hypothetical protein [Candidatus Aphodousia gallistercoris]